MSMALQTTALNHSPDQASVTAQPNAQSPTSKVYLWTGRVIQYALGALFLWTSIPKIVAPTEFLSSIYNYELLSPDLAMVMAVVMPWVEFLAGTCLLGGLCVPAALVTCAAMFATFALAHASVLYRGMSIDCGCGLIPGDDHVTYLTLARSLFLSCSAILAYWCVRRIQRDNPATAGTPIPESAAVVQVAVGQQASEVKA